MQTTTIRPGLLVSLHTSISGNVSYRAVTLETEHTTENGELRARWETEKTVANPAEHKRATEIRSKARSLIASVCAHSAFGLLCPEADAAILADKIKEAQQLAADFNATAELTRIRVSVLAGKIAADDVQAAQAISGEIRDLLDNMAEGVRKMDVEAIRDAANRAKRLDAMVSPDASVRLQKAIDAARSAARQIVKAGETAAQEVDKRALRIISEGRTAFLDLDDAKEIAAPAVQGRAVDMEEEEPSELRPDPTNPAATLQAAPQLELV